MKLNYLTATSGGKMRARGKTIRIGKSICLGEASVEDERGALLAHGTATLMIVRNLKLKGEAVLPPKYTS
jgi:acyl-coenzyme A thioesterase PaaI-like protein